MNQLARRRIALTLAAIAGAHAQPFPSRPITLIVPFPPGGSTDTTARIMAERMRPILGQPIVIENVGGAGGSIGVGRVARAPADGYTIDIGQWDTHVGSIIYKLNYDLEKDFEPIGLISNNPQLLVAKKNLAANNLNELVALMKKDPGKVTFVNQNAAAQVSGILLQQLTKTEVTFIPYRGAGPAMTDLISGQVDLLVVQGAVALPQVRAGTIKAIANLSPQRSASMPDIPTSDEGGVPGFHVGLVRLLGAEGHAEGRDRQAQRGDACRCSPIRPPRRGSPSSGSTSPRPRSRRRKGSRHSRRPRSRSGGRSSRRRASRRSEAASASLCGRLLAIALGQCPDRTSNACFERPGVLPMRRFIATMLAAALSFALTQAASPTI